MAAPHNPARIGEVWKPDHLAVMLAEIMAVREFVTISGGWAWHFMTPAGHAELKHAHDHKDADLFVEPCQFAALVAILKERGFERVWTRFDDAPGSDSFYRYTKSVETDSANVKVMFDVFTESIPSVETAGFRVVEPSHLLSLYGKKHGSDLCFSVQIARQLIAKGAIPVQHSAMANYSRFLAAAEQATGSRAVVNKTKVR